MLAKMKKLVKSQSFCVLATVSGGQPHCSLMSYATDAQCREIYMVTFRNTKKYRNLTGNPAISLLIDTRDQDLEDRHYRTRALTVNGVFESVTNRAKRDKIKARLLKRHPHLAVLAEDPEAEFIVVRIKSLQLLEGIAEASYATV